MGGGVERERVVQRALYGGRTGECDLHLSGAGHELERHVDRGGVVGGYDADRGPVGDDGGADGNADRRGKRSGEYWSATGIFAGGDRRGYHHATGDGMGGGAEWDRAVQ